jgi:hypothetical protein
VVGCIIELSRLRKKFGTLCMATSDLARKYTGGQMVGLRVGNDYQVVLTSAEAIKEMSNKPEFEGRPRGPFSRFRTCGLRRGQFLIIILFQIKNTLFFRKPCF